MKGSAIKTYFLHDIEQRATGLYDVSPRHITLSPPIKVPDESLGQLAEIAEEISREFEPFVIRAGGIDHFGENNDIAVVKINDMSGELHRIHRKIIAEMGRVGLGDLIDMRWAGDNYQPHSTEVENVPFPEGDYLVENFSLLAKQPDGRIKLARYSLGGA